MKEKLYWVSSPRGGNEDLLICSRKWNVTIWLRKRDGKDDGTHRDSEENTI